MKTIRALERDDLPEVAALYELAMRSGERVTRPEMVSFFERTLLEQPWAHSELPSLVHLDRGGRIIAFLGSHPRRMRLDEEPLMLACSGQLVADPEAERPGAGAMLLARYLKGPQDLTITDGATPTVHKIWTRLGGQPSALGCIGWTRVFRPSQFLAEVRARRRGNARRRRSHGPLAALDAIAAGAGSRVLVPPAVASRTEPLTPEGIMERLPEVTRSRRLWPDYELQFVHWLFDELVAVRGRGELMTQVVLDAQGGFEGWYVYYLQAGGSSAVIQIAARDGRIGSVIDHLFREAQQGGAAALHGRLEPILVEPLAERRCILRYTGGALLHSRRDEVLGMVASPRSMLTRLEGEWWMSPHLAAFA